MRAEVRSSHNITLELGPQRVTTQEGNLGDALLFLPHDLDYRRIKLSAKLNTYVLSHRGQAKQWTDFSNAALERTLCTHRSQRYASIKMTFTPNFRLSALLKDYSEAVKLACKFYRL